MPNQDRRPGSDHLAELRRLRRRYVELREEDLAKQARADREIDEALARLREVELRLARPIRRR
jgi:hypothetical protein